MKTILVPTDFSDAAQNAADFAAKLAGDYNANLILLNVFNPSIAGIDAMTAAEIIRDAEKSSESDLLQLKQKFSNAGFKNEVHCVSSTGLALSAIESTVSNYKVDLIVMGITGSAGIIKEKVIGSTTLDVARDLNTPLIIVPEGVAYNKINKISFACDVYNLKGSGVLEKVKLLCEEFKAGLEIVNVERPEVEDKPIKERNYNFMESVLVDLKHETIILKEDDSHNALRNHFNQHTTDLIILNPKKQNFVQSLFHKSMTKQMAFHGKTPLLIVH